MPKRKSEKQLHSQLQPQQPNGMFDRDAGLNFNLVIHVFSFLERGFPQWNKLVLTQRDWRDRSLDTAWVKLLRGTLHPRLVDSGLPWVTKMTALTQLNLGLCPSISHSGVVLLSSLTSLTHLSLCGCYNIGDAGIQSLSRLTGLTYLNLGDCHNIGDAGWQSLSSLTALTGLVRPSE